MLFSSFEIPSRMFGRSFTRCELQRRLFATLCLVSQIILLSDIGGISVSSLARTDRSESDSVLLLKLARNYQESNMLVCALKMDCPFITVKNRTPPVQKVRAFLLLLFPSTASLG